jgi:hypothetical protein
MVGGYGLIKLLEARDSRIISCEHADETYSFMKMV